MSDIKNEANYKTMYTTLFTAQLEVIELLQQAQQKAERIYISTPSAEDEMVEDVDDNRDA